MIHLPLEKDRYELMHQIGHSAFCGTECPIYVAKCLDNQLMVAVKIVDLDVCSITSEQVVKECKFWSTCEHPNMIDYIGSIVDGSTVWIITEYMNAGSIRDVMLFGFSRGFNEVVIATLLRDILQFLVYFHESKQIHRNLKTTNILLSLEGDVKVGGVSCSAALIEEGQRMRARYTIMEPSPYAAPEALMEGTGHSEKVDIWSLGIIVYEMCEGANPYAGMTGLEVIKAIVSEEAPELPLFDQNKKPYSPLMRDFIKQCLNKDPSKRPDAATLLRHGLLKRARDCEFLVDTVLGCLPPLFTRYALMNGGSEPEHVESSPKKVEFDFDITAESEEKTIKGRFTVSRRHSSPAACCKGLDENCEDQTAETTADVETDVQTLTAQLSVLEEAHKEIQDLIDATQENVRRLMEQRAKEQ